MRSKKLNRQLKKTLNSEEFEKELLEFAEQLKSERPLDRDQANHWSERLGQFGLFLDSIDNSYAQNETMLELANRSLEVSTKELYEANEKFRLINNAITAMVNSLDEGFLVIDRAGLCGQVVSLAAKNFLGREPVNEHLCTILNIPMDDQESFNEWLNMVFDEIIPFEDLIELAPKSLGSPDNATGKHSPESERKIEIKYKPIRHPYDNKILELVVILIDVSERAEAERKLGEQKLFTDMVIKYLNNKANFVRMIQMLRETADSMKSWVFSPVDLQDQYDRLTRELHTLKGGLNTLSMYSLGYKIHQTEDEIITFFKMNNNPKDSENLIHLLGHELQEALDEFIYKHRRIFRLDNKAAAIKEIPTNNVYKFCAQLLKMGLPDLLKYYVNEIVAVPFASMFAAVEAHLYSLSLSQDKQVDFKVIDDEKIRVIPEFYTALLEQLVHLFNNMMEHGIEPTEEREALGKEQVGKITVVVQVIDDLRDHKQRLRLTITDDGRGIDASKIRERLSERGVDTSGETDEQVIYHIFDQGLSTKTSVSVTSGRGVGMASVQSAINGIGGSIAVRSVLGQGTTFELIIPFVQELSPSMVEWFNNEAKGHLMNLRSNAS